MHWHARSLALRAKGKISGKTVAALAALVTLTSHSATAATQSALARASQGQAAPSATIAQLPRYSASGIHQCGAGGKHSCVVTGLFSDCNQAATSLRTQDCCPTSKGGGTSTAFTLTYCIPDYTGR
jgi:hypothetical protein